MTEQVKEQTFFSDVVDGAAAVTFLKDDVTIDTIGKRVGAVTPGIVLGAFAHGRLMVKRGLAVLPKQDREAVINATPLGSLTIGK